MKKLVKSILVSFSILFAMNTQAQNADIKLTKSVELNASADDVWASLRQLDKFGELFPNFISEVWIDGYKKPKAGLERKCTAPGQPKGTVSYKETIKEFNEKKRFYSYAVEGIPAQGMVNSFEVISLGKKKSKVIWKSEGGKFMENPQMTKVQFEEFMGSALDEAMSVLAKKFN